MMSLFHKKIALLLLVRTIHFIYVQYKFIILIGNILKAQTFTDTSERNFNERLLVSLGFVKVRKKVFFI